MRIGLYVTSLNPKGVSQARFQTSVLEGLARHNAGRHHFTVFADSDTTGFDDNESFAYVKLRRERKPRGTKDFLKRHFGRVGRSASRVLRLKEGRILEVLRRWRESEKIERPYYAQLRESGIRLMWWVNGHELPSWLPFVKTVWEANHRIHSMYPEYSYTRFRFEGLDTPLSLAKASYLITGTEEGKRQLITMFGVYERKVRVIPFPTPILPAGSETSRPDLVREIGRPYVFYPARLWPHKNHVVIVAALRILRDKWQLTVNLVLSGVDEGNLSYVLDYAQALGVRNQIVYAGQVSDAHLVSLYKNALALVYASAVGPDNMPPLEAMAVGCPAIVADVPGAREQYGDAALFFDPVDEVALSNLIKQLLDDPSAREVLISKGLTRAGQWSVEDYAAEVFSIFEEFELIARAWGSSEAVFT